MRRVCEGNCEKCDSKVSMVRVSKESTGYNSVQSYCSNAIFIASTEGFKVKVLGQESSGNQYNTNEDLVA